MYTASSRGNPGEETPVVFKCRLMPAFLYDYNQILKVYFTYLEISIEMRVPLETSSSVPLFPYVNT